MRIVVDFLIGIDLHHDILSCVDLCLHIEAHFYLLLDLDVHLVFPWALPFLVPPLALPTHFFPAREPVHAPMTMALSLPPAELRHMARMVSI